MAKVRRFSGDVKIELSFNDRTNQYKAKLCPVRPLWKGKAQTRCETVLVGLPKGRLERAVDSPRAYDQAARAALSFSKEAQDYAAGSRDGSGWHISRGRRRRAKALRR